MGQIYSESLESRILAIQGVCKTSLPHIFHGIPENGTDPNGYNESTSKTFIESLCHHFTEIVDSFANHDKDAVELRQDIGMSFLKETVPLLVEALLRRKTLRLAISS